jgi:hypothetical protein
MNEDESDFSYSPVEFESDNLMENLDINYIFIIFNIYMLLGFRSTKAFLFLPKINLKFEF